MLVVVGTASVVAGVTHVIGHLYGYLVMWAVVLPVAALVAAGVVRWPDEWSARMARTIGVAAVRLGLVVMVAVVSVAAMVRVASIPPLSTASDPEVAQLVALVTPHLRPGESVAVNDGRAGTSPDNVLINIERFFGLIDVLDREGYKPKVEQVLAGRSGARLLRQRDGAAQHPAQPPGPQRSRRDSATSVGWATWPSS